MKNLFIRMIYSNLFTYLIIGNDEDIDDIENDTEDIKEKSIISKNCCIKIEIPLGILVQIHANINNILLIKAF
jgi:hypothetical protein